MEELEQLNVNSCVCVHSAAVEPVCHSRYVGDPTVGMTVEVGTHIPEDDVWHLWLGVHLHVCNSPLVVSSGQISGDPLGPFRCVSQGRLVWVIPLEDSCSSKIQAERIWTWKEYVHYPCRVIRPWGGDLR